MTREHFERLCFGDYVEPETQWSWLEVPGRPGLVYLAKQSRGELLKLYPGVRRTFEAADEPRPHAEAMRDEPTLVYNQQTWCRLMRDPWLAAQVRP